MGKNRLICHILEGKKEVGTAKGKTYEDTIKWNKRAWTISQQARDRAYIVDKKGLTHIFVQVNTADSIMYPLTHTQLSLIDSKGELIDKCGECGGQISIDATAHRIALNKTIYKSFWGIDNSYMLLLLIMAIVCVILVGALFFMVGEANKTNTLLQKYLKPPEDTNTVTSSQFILPMVLYIE